MDEFKKMLLLKRDSVPSSYSAVDAGLVSSVKNREIAEAVWLSVCILLLLSLSILISILNISNI